MDVDVVVVVERSGADSPSVVVAAVASRIWRGKLVDKLGLVVDRWEEEEKEG